MFKPLGKREAEIPAQIAPPPRAPVVTPVRPSLAPGTQIAYYPDLITRFNGCHVSLRKVFGAIKANAMNNRFADAHKSLQSFRRILTDHLLEENIKLYAYLARCMVHDPDNMSLVRDMKAEMAQIGTTVMRFLNSYTKAGITPFNKIQFLRELDDVGAVLVDRMEREEQTLYTIYMPPEAFAD